MTATGALSSFGNFPSAIAGSPAPDSGASAGWSVFGQQLQNDDSGTLVPPTDSPDSQPVTGQGHGLPKAAHAAAPLPKDEQLESPFCGFIPVLLPVVPATPLPLTLALPAADTTSEPAPAPADSVPIPVPPPAVDAPAPPAPVDKDLTFALKVKPEAASTSPAPHQTERPVHAVAAVKESSKPDLEQDDPHGADTPEPALHAAPLVVDRLFTPPPAPHGESSAPPAPAETAPVSKAIEQPPAKPAEPLKQLSIQLGQAQQQRVEVRLVERSGELQVAVRAANPDVAQGLRQGLSDLVGRLEQNGFRADAWRPGAAVTAAPAVAQSSQKSPEFQHNGSQQQSGGSPQERQQQGNSHSPHRPRWVEELENSFPGGAETGDSHGIRD